MKLALMQPYLFPYIGYFQLISACDLFVLHDDVQYIKGGWINRNRILVNGQPKYIILPLRKDDFSKLINERHFTDGVSDEKALMLRQIEGAYRKAPFFRNTLELVDRCLACTDSNLAVFVTHTLAQCCQHLQIQTPIMVSSTIAKDAAPKAEDRVIHINKLLGADHYINPPGGIELYQRQKFAEHRITLSFLQPRQITYTQFGNPFVPSLSIIDVLMFNSAETTRGLLALYDLV
jgi:hypothetical protein